MTRSEQMERLGAYLSDLAARLRLSDWTIHLSEEPAESDCWAQIEPVRGRKRATVRVCWEFFDQSPEIQRHTLCHELIHCHHAVVDDMTEPLLDEAGRVTYRMAREYAVDAMADVIAPHMPLPLWDVP
jgi:hypothetical protein